MKKIIAFTLAALFILAAVVGCSKPNNDKPSGTTAPKDQPGDDTSGEITTAADTKPFYIDLDYDGAEILPTCRDEYNNFVIGENNGDIFFQSIYDVNQMVEDHLGVDIEFEFGSKSTEQFINQTAKLILGNDCPYDIVLPDQFYSSTYITQGAFLDAAHLNTEHNYIDLDKDCWYHYYMDNLKINGDQTFFLSGSLSPSILAWTGCTFVNINMYNDIFGNSINEFLDDVEAGKWTIDLMREKCEATYIDLNNNSKVDENDRLGGCVTEGQSAEFAAMSAGLKFSRTLADGSMIVTGDEEVSIKAFEKTFDLYNNTLGFYDYKFTDLSNLVDSQKFAEDTCLFVPEYIIYAFWEDMRNMESSYVIIPRPKADEQQEQYISCTQDCFFLYAIPTSTPTDKLEPISAVIETMCELYDEKVIPNMYEVSLKIKYAAEEIDPEQTSRLLDLIRDNITTDFAVVFNTSLARYPGQAANCVYSTRESWSRLFGIQKKSIQLRLDTLIASLEKLK
ncbi:MAG: hypothetical protein KBT31_04290 [Firmicutes bacterium]|nr:hypothetical protein [Candidatus Colimorpha enterica]